MAQIGIENADFYTRFMDIHTKTADSVRVKSGHCGPYGSMRPHLYIEEGK